MELVSPLGELVETGRIVHDPRYEEAILRPGEAWGFVDNRKPNAAALFDIMSNAAVSKLGIGRSLRFSKPSPVQAPTELLERLREECGAVLIGSAD